MRRHPFTARSCGYWAGDSAGAAVFLAGARAAGVAQFDRVRDVLVVAGHLVISPVDLDRQNCPMSDEARRLSSVEALSSVATRRRSVVMLLAGWEQCGLAQFDVALAELLGIRIVDTEWCEVDPCVTVLAALRPVEQTTGTAA